MLVSAAVDEFLLSLAPGRSANTMATYRSSIYPLIEWCEANNVETVDQFNRTVVRRYMAAAGNRYAQYSLRNVSNLTKRFLRWLALEHGTADLTQYVTTPPLHPTLQRALSRDEVRELQEACDDSPLGRRNALIISLLLDTGMRASELVRINIGDVLPKEQRVRIRIKGGREYRVKYGDHTARLLREWLRELPNDSPKAPLFISVGGTKHGTRISRQGLRKILLTLGERAGVPNVTVHSFRRTFATELLRQGVPTRIVQILGRWQSMAMVELYSKQLEQESINISLSDIFANDTEN